MGKRAWNSKFLYFDHILKFKYCKIQFNYTTSYQIEELTNSI